MAVAADPQLPVHLADAAVLHASEGRLRHSVGDGHVVDADAPGVHPFGQAEAGLNRQYEGTGLGLTLTKALTELHGGRLQIESCDTGPETGTTVTAIFPAERVIA